MVRRRFAKNEKTNAVETCVNGRDGSDYGAVKRAVLNGYIKLLALLFLFIVALLLKNFVIDIATVAGDSMNPNFYQNDVLVVDKTATEFERFDVVVVKTSSKKLIKRVIGLPNETVQISDGNVFINGVKIEGEYDFYTESGGVANEPYTLGKDEYFLIGDNRGGSYDSRDFGAVNVDDIQGVMVFRILPLKDFGKI